MKYLALIVAFTGVLGAGACNSNPDTKTSATGPAATDKAPKEKVDLSKLKHATFAGGCFWCEEAVFESIKGVGEVVSGYSGGKTQNPTYEEVGMGSTGHAESIEVYYDSSKIDFPTLVDVFIASIDPFQPNGQGPDHGTQYRSIIFYRNDTEKAIAEKKIDAVNRKSELEKRKSAVEILPFVKFWEAEEYHQDYVPNHPENPYVQHESIPRVKRTQKQVMDWVKPDKVMQ